MKADGTVSPKGHESVVLGILEADNSVKNERSVINSRPGATDGDEAGDDLLGAEPIFFDPCVFALDLPAFTGLFTQGLGRPSLT